jgi:hypothetical protein
MIKDKKDFIEELANIRKEIIVQKKDINTKSKKLYDKAKKLYKDDSKQLEEIENVIENYKEFTNDNLSNIKLITKNKKDLSIQICLELLENISWTIEATTIIYNEQLNNIWTNIIIKKDTSKKTIKFDKEIQKELDELNYNLTTCMYDINDILRKYKDDYDFIEYIRPKIRLLEYNPNDYLKLDFTGILIKENEDNSIEDIRVILPPIVNNITLILNTKYIRQTYLFYKTLSQEEKNN